MDHKRAIRGVIAVTALFFVALAIWVTFLAPHAPEGTLPYEIAILVFGYGFLLGLALLWAQRASRADRKLYKHGYEGWATITSVRTIPDPDAAGERAELELKLTVPGSESYAGKLVRTMNRHERTVLVVGATVPIRVDPHNRDHIMLCP
ncbi:hypothetical protein [Tomitella biformata]|uniref:hypothetical protein n=1 Tax=Tomitella biformata TaxID=630403 RepID=UPI000466A58C|nr:hypothetical protein [Tomitella biformata]